MLQEHSLVRLTMNALQGVESSLISIDKFSAIFCSESADRTSHRISSLWTWSFSTVSLGNLLKSIGQFGCIVFLLHRFVHHFNSYGSFDSNEHLERNNSEGLECDFSLVNQAFAVAVKKVLDGYISALNTIYASVTLRRTSKHSDGGCLMDMTNADITLLEVYLHTRGLRTQMEALGNICCVNGIAHKFSESPLEGLRYEANLEFSNFPRGGALLTYLYTHLKVADPVHSTLLRFLFLRSFEPYYGFIRSWIYEGRIIDPYKDFAVECAQNTQALAANESGLPAECPSNTFRMRDGVTLPCFMEECLTPLLRAGQQLQVVMKLVELCSNLDACSKLYLEVLPLDNLSKGSVSSPAFTFQKGDLENMELKRSEYYNIMFEKVEQISTPSEFRSRQASSQTYQLLYAMRHGRNLKHADSVMGNSLIMPLMDGRNQNTPLDAVVDDTSNTTDESSYSEDLLESECSSVSSNEEQNESNQMLYVNVQLEPDYLSSLSFSVSSTVNNEIQKPPQSELVYSTETPLFGICDGQHISWESRELNSRGSGRSENLLPYQLRYSWSLDDQAENINSKRDINVLSLCPKDDPPNVDGDKSSMSWVMLPCEKEVNTLPPEVEKLTMLCGSDELLAANSLIERISSIDQYTDRDCCLSVSPSEQSWTSKYSPKFFCMNPALSKRNKPEEGTSTDCKQPLSYFNFTTVSNPSGFGENLTSGSRHQLGAVTPFLSDIIGTSTTNASGSNYRECRGDKISGERPNTLVARVPSDLKVERRQDNSDASMSGGSSWETLLSCLGNTSNVGVTNYRASSEDVMEMPLNYVITKCLREEILLQYRYVSRLTIKLLDEGFSLQDHFLALRKYHFMDVADWVDLFIMSLWHHKWYVVEVDKRILEIQGILDLSVQRSSCEGDRNRDRLYVYMKGECRVSLPTSAKGIHSFDFLGLGYRVDWPVSIILTPFALNTYSDIFNFLIQIKLCTFSLTDAWCLLKNLVQMTDRCCSELPKPALHCISILTQTRHMLNHFVSTLQQYVQSQLTHVSWCKFLDSLNHKVKDMVDLETVHMEYLTESMQICFLSVETGHVRSIIQSMLQCAVDFRSCLIGYGLGSVASGKDCLDDLSKIDIAQVLSIKDTFTRSLNDLFVLHLKSPKHGDYGVSSFWEYLNSNNYYSSIIVKRFGHSVFPI